MQAIKYAAMASRFTPESLSAQHARFVASRGKTVTDEEALELLEEHIETKSLDVEALRQPRIVLLASAFPPVVTATAVWLREMGLDISLIRFQAYRTEQETLVTVSQLLPLPTVEEFTVVPRGPIKGTSSTTAYPIVPWTPSDIAHVAQELTNPGVRGVLDLCPQRPGEQVSYTEVTEYTGRDRSVIRADLAGLTIMVKRRFGRANWPFDREWITDKHEAFYSMDKDRAEAWATTMTANEIADSVETPRSEPPI